MPITQERMEEVISAGTRYRDLFRELQRRVRSLSITEPDLCAAEATQLYSDTFGPLFSESVRDAEVLSAEAMHFKHARYRNKLGRDKRRHKREFAQGLRSDAPPEVKQHRYPSGVTRPQALDITKLERQVAEISTELELELAQFTPTKLKLPEVKP